MYALGDFRLPAPVSLDFVGWLLGGIILYSIPLFLLIGMSNMTIFYAVIVFGPPIAIASLSTKPIFQGRNLVQFLIATYNYFNLPAGWVDLEGYESRKEMEFTVEHTTWVSRRREFLYLANLEDAEKKQKRAAEKTKR